MGGLIHQFAPLDLISIIHHMNSNTEEVKKILKLVWVVLIVLVIFLGAQTLGVLKNIHSVNPTYNSISVSGVGEAVAVPDVATFSFTVSADAPDVGDAQAQVTKKMDTILDGLKTFGVEKKDINTIDYSIWPKYTFGPTICTPTYCPQSRQVADGYTVTHNVSVKVKSIENVGKALDIVGRNGATGLSSITFTVDDHEKTINEARAKMLKSRHECYQDSLVCVWCE
jgi:uncharacterized protein YggE